MLPFVHRMPKEDLSTIRALKVYKNQLKIVLYQ